MKATSLIVLIAYCLSWQLVYSQCFHNYDGLIFADPCNCIGDRSCPRRIPPFNQDDLDPPVYQPESATIIIHSQFGNAPIEPYATPLDPVTINGRDFRFFPEQDDNGVGTTPDVAGFFCLGTPLSEDPTRPVFCDPVFGPADNQVPIFFSTAEHDPLNPNIATKLIIKEQFPAATWNGLYNGLPMETLGATPIFFAFREAPQAPFTVIETGFYLEVSWNCNDELVGSGCVDRIGSLGSSNYDGLTTLEKFAVAGQTFCCRQTGSYVPAIGTCINIALESCCGVAIDKFTQRCCNDNNQFVANINENCPCTRALPLVCPAGEQCCLFSKYPELATDSFDFGTCFDPLREACCDEGTVFEPGVQQCCPINGVQNANVPCPCDDDSDCPVNGKTGVQHLCCQQTAPPVTSELCDVFMNYPVGASPYLTGSVDHFVQRCPGICIDPSYQICCNGVACVLNYDRCCNNTCCNQFTESCLEARRSGLPGNRYNHNNFNLFAENVPMVFAQCSQIENMNLIAAWWIFVMPSALTLLTLLGVGIAIIVWYRVPKLRVTVWERVIFAVAILEAFLAIPLYWSPLYKYGVTVAIPAIFELVLLAAALEFHGPPEYGDIVPSLAGGFGIATIFQVVALISVLQPFIGNPFFDAGCDNTGDIIPNDRLFQEQVCREFCSVDDIFVSLGNALPNDPIYTDLGFAQVFDTPRCFTDCVNQGRPDPVPEGQCNTIALGAFFTLTVTMLRAGNECVDFYKYFSLDPALRDFDRRDNEVIQTFGYCSPGWLLAILYFDGFIVMIALILLGFSLVAFVTSAMARQALKLL